MLIKPRKTGFLLMSHFYHIRKDVSEERTRGEIDICFLDVDDRLFEPRIRRPYKSYSNKNQVEFFIANLEEELRETSRDRWF